MNKAKGRVGNIASVPLAQEKNTNDLQGTQFSLALARKKKKWPQKLHKMEIVTGIVQLVNGDHGGGKGEEGFDLNLWLNKKIKAIEEMKVVQQHGTSTLELMRGRGRHRASHSPPDHSLPCAAISQWCLRKKCHHCI
jgi:hypothetical protein